MRKMNGKRRREGKLLDLPSGGVRVKVVTYVEGRGGGVSVKGRKELKICKSISRGENLGGGKK